MDALFAPKSRASSSLARTALPIPWPRTVGSV